MSIRAADPEDAPAIARVHVDSWRTTYRGLLPDHVLANLSLEERQASWQQRIDAPALGRCSGFVFVAEDVTGRVVGFASGGPERENDSDFEGELYAIYLLKEHQGRGLGRRLTKHVVERLRSLGHNSMRVWGLEGKPRRVVLQTPRRRDSRREDHQYRRAGLSRSSVRLEEPQPVRAVVKSEFCQHIAGCLNSVEALDLIRELLAHFGDGHRLLSPTSRLLMRKVY